MRKILTTTLILCSIFLGCENENVNDINIKGRAEIDCNKDIYLTTQEDIENFDCGTVNGRLKVGSIDIEPLEIKNYHFSSLKSVRNGLILENISELEENSFNSLVELRGRSTIWNSDFTELNAFNNLEIISSGDIAICYNRNLKEIRGFDNLLRVRGFLNIHNNSNLEYINAFNELLDIESFSIISYNDNLIEISGFNNLKTITRYNQGGSLSILENPNLRNISGYNNLEAVPSGFSIKYNPNLDCKYLCNFIGKADNGQYDIYDNKCENYEQVKDICW